MSDLIQALLQECVYTPNDNFDFSFQTLLNAPVPSLTFDASPASVGSPDLAYTFTPNFLGSASPMLSSINMSPLSEAELDLLLAS